MVELKQFVSETLKQIIDGVLEAQDYASKHMASVNPRGHRVFEGTGIQDREMSPTLPLHPVEFDVAVSSEAKDSAQGGVGVFVGPLAVGTKGTMESASQGMSRIHFTIPVVLPTQNLPR